MKIIAPFALWPASSRRPGAPSSLASAASASSTGMPAPMASPAATIAFDAWKAPASGRRTSWPRPKASMRRRWRKPFGTISTMRSSRPARPVRIRVWPRRVAAATTVGGAVAVHVDDRRPARGQDRGEEAELGGEIVRDGRMVVHVVAAEIGEAGGRNAETIEPALVEPVARGLDRRGGHPLPDKPRRAQRGGRSRRASSGCHRRSSGG